MQAGKLEPEVAFLNASLVCFLTEKPKPFESLVPFLYLFFCSSAFEVHFDLVYFNVASINFCDRYPMFSLFWQQHIRLL